MSPDETPPIGVVQVDHRSTTPSPRRGAGDGGETMMMATVLISFLLLASWALISGSQQWGARRDIQAASSAAARAGAQVSELEVRGGDLALDPRLVQQRVELVLAASGYSGTAEIIDAGLTVRVTATGSVSYAFPAPGFPTSLTASGSSSAVSGVVSGG
jgi:Flp pilus assembly protein TadG